MEIGASLPEAEEEDFRKYYRPNYSSNSLSPRSHLMAKRISLEIFRTSSIFLEHCYSKRNYITEENSTIISLILICV